MQGEGVPGNLPTRMGGAGHQNHPCKPALPEIPVEIHAPPGGNCHLIPLPPL